MRKLVLFVVAAMALAATAALAIAAGSSSSQPTFHGWNSTARSAAESASAPPAGSHRIVVIEQEVRSAFVDVGAAGESPGDSFIFEGRLWNAGRTRVVGRDSGQCTIRIRSFHCNATAFLMGRGTITIDGATFGPDLYAIVGGTGHFAGAGGELRVREAPHNMSRLTFYLVR
jgi:hypothetical protein